MPWWWWPLGFALAALIAFEVNLGVAALPDWLPFATLFTVAAATLLWLGRVEIRVTQDSGTGRRGRTVGRARAPARHRDRPIRRNPALGQVSGAGPPARPGGLRAASGMGRTDGSAGPR